jgi:hypothetical protein
VATSFDFKLVATGISQSIATRRRTNARRRTP